MKLALLSVLASAGATCPGDTTRVDPSRVDARTYHVNGHGRAGSSITRYCYKVHVGSQVEQSTQLPLLGANGLQLDAVRVGLRCGRAISKQRPLDAARLIRVD